MDRGQRAWGGEGGGRECCPGWEPAPCRRPSPGLQERPPRKFWRESYSLYLSTCRKTKAHFCCPGLCFSIPG